MGITVLELFKHLILEIMEFQRTLLRYDYRGTTFVRLDGLFLAGNIIYEWKLSLLVLLIMRQEIRQNTMVMY